MKQGRVVIIGGTPRAGKTTVAVGLTHHGFSILSLDHLSEALHKGFPEIIIEDWTSQESCAKKKYQFFESIVSSAVNDAKIYGINTVMDMYDFTPEYISRLPFQNEIEVYFLAYPTVSVDEIKYNIKYYAKPTDWISQVDEEYLAVVAQRCHDVNEKLVCQCKEYGYELINTGAGEKRVEILHELINRITNS